MVSKKTVKTETKNGVTSVTANATDSVNPEAVEVDESGVVLNVNDIEAAISKGSMAEARRLLNETPAKQVDFRFILLIGDDNISRLNPPVELSKSPAFPPLVSSLAEWGWMGDNSPVTLRRVKAQPRDIEAHRNLLIQISNNVKKVNAGIYGEATIDNAEMIKWLLATIVFDEKAEYYVPVAGFRRCMALPFANYARAYLHMKAASFLDAKIVPEDCEEAILANINGMENTLKNKGLEGLTTADYYKLALELKRRDPLSSKTTYCAAMGIARATAEKYIEAASIAMVHPDLKLCTITGRVPEAVPSEMTRIVKLFCLTDDQIKAAYAAIYSFKGMTSSAEFMALRDGRLAPGSTVELSSNLAKFREDFGKWIEARKPNLLASATTLTGGLKRMVEGMCAPTLLWEEVNEVQLVAYLLFKSGILGDGGKREKTIAKSALSEMATNMKGAGLSTLAPIVEAIAEGDEGIAKARIASLASAGQAIKIVMALVDRVGPDRVVAELKKLDETL